MRSSLRSFRYAPDSDGREGFFGDLRESFTDLFAYDRFDWPDLPSPSSVAFHAIKPVEGARGSSGIADDPVTLYTTTNSDVPIRTFGQVVEVDGGTVPLSNTSGPVIGVDDFRLDARFAGIDGSGYSVVVLDSGIDLDDPFFGPDANNDGVADRIVYHYDFADNDADASDVDGHGSNVTSIAASSDGTYTGMAPGADIISLKVFSDNGSGFFSDIEQALQWVINNAEAYNIASVNMSLGDGGNYGSPVGLYGIADELSVLASMDVIVVSASGNSFYEVNSIQGVAYPSADPNSLSVGAVYDSSGGGFSYGSGAIAYSRTTDQITPFSQRDDNLSDVFAPGAPITGAGAGAGLTTMHGTSQAAPHIAGIAVLAQQLAEQELGRKLTVTEFTDLLASSGDSIFDGDDEDDNVVNTGSTYQRVNVLALAEAIIALAPPDLDPAVFSISALDAEKPEGDSGTTGYSFTVTRSGNTSGNDSVDYGITGSGADPSDADDFQGGGFPSGQVTFAPGETSKVVTVEVLGDSDLESDEGFTVTLSNPSVGAQISIDSADGTIQNDDTAPPPPGETVVLIDSDFDDPGAGADGFTYVADAFGGTTGPSYTRGAWSEGELTMLLGGSDNDDIFDMSGGWQRSFTLDQDAEVSLSFLYTLTQAQSYEADEYSQVLFSLNGGPPQLVAEIVGDGNGGGEKTTGQQAFVADLGLLPAGTHTIVLGGYNNKKTYNNESTEIRFDDVQVTGTPTAPPATFLAIAADDAVKAEGDGGSTAFTFTVTRTGDTSQAGSVDYAVTSTQADGADFLGGVLPGGTVAFGAGEASKTLTVEVAGDTDFEGDEAFTVTLSNPSAGSEITGASAAGTIQNDDPVPPATFLAIAADDAVKAEGDGGSTAFTFTVTRTGDTSQAGSVDYAVTSAEADGTDFFGGTLPSGTVAFGAGEASKTLTIEVAGDTDFEGDEAFTVTLSNASTGSEITGASAAGTIQNDDPAPPATFLSVAADDAVKAEGDAGSTAFTFTVTRTGDSSQAGNVDYAVTSADADGTDFFGGTLPSGTVAFGAGEASKTLTIEVAGDTDFEGDEAFTVTLSNASTGSEITGASAAGTIQNDDTLPPAGPIVLIDEDFDGPGDTGGFAYEDGNFGGGNPQAYADGTWNGGALTLNLGGIDNTTVTDISGGWTASFTLDTESEVSLSFLYEMIHAEGYEDDEFSQVLVSIDGGPPVLVSTLTGDGNGGGAQTTGPQTFSAALGVLAAGDHSLTIGGLNNKKTWANETTDVLVDDVLLTAVPQDPSPPVVTSYTIDPLNAVQTEGDDGATAFTFTVTRSGDLTGSGSVEFSIAGSEAGADDFLGGLLPGGSVTFAADEVSRTIVIEVAGDTDFETDEDFVVTLSNPSAGSEIAIASAAGTILNDDTAPVGPVTLLDARFDTAGDTAGFVYRDGSFGGPGFQSNADGDWDSGRLAINLGGGGNTTTLDLSGAWEVGFTVTAEMDVVLAFDYELIMSAFYEADEFSQALVSLNDGAPILVDQLVGDGNGGSDDTSGLQSALLDLGRLAAGDYSLAIGAYNNKKTWANETTELTIDDVLVTGSLPAGSDVDLSATLIGSNLSDPSITETELQAVAGF